MDQANNKAKGIFHILLAAFGFAALFGFIFFREMPDIWSFLGYVIIIATAVVKWYYNLHIKD